MKTIPCTKIIQEKNHIYQGINMTITPILYILHSTLLIYFGIKKTLTESIRDTNNKYNINIKLK